MDIKAIEEIKEKLARQELILFVGAGIPKCIGLPDWQGLIDHIAGELGFESDIFEGLGNYPSLIEYYSIQKGGVDSLIEWMRKNWLIDKMIVQTSKIYANLVGLGCKRIYTTNYEDSIEKAHEWKKVDYVSIATIKDFVGIRPEATQIIKFHGDLARNTNLVLTESDYFRRLDFESPLDIKLRSDIIGKSVLFIGYSLTDINMRYLIFKLNSLWKDVTDKPRSYIFLASPNPIGSAVFESWGITPIIGAGIDRRENLERFLGSLVTE